MHRRLTELSLALVCSLALAACGEKPADKKPAEEAHDHKAPHGGEILELGNEEGHLEMIHDHDGGKVTVYVFGSSFEKPLHVAKPTITVQQKDGTSVDVPLTAVDAKPDGTGHQWKGEHAALKTDPWDGRIRLQIAGKNYQSPLEGPGHDHK